MNVRQSYVIALGGAVSLVVALTAGNGYAEKQTATATLSIGSPPAGAQVGDRVQVPVTLVADSISPTSILLVLEFDTGKLAFVDAQVGPSVPSAHGIQPFAVEGPSVTRLSIVIFEFSLMPTPIPDGVVFLIDFDIIGGGANEAISIRADTDSSAADADDNDLTLTLEDGVIDLGCPVVTSPTGVAASEGDTDGVLVTWTAVAGLTEYQVYRSDTADSTGAAPLSGWISDTTFFDATADLPITVPGSGCNATPTTMLVEYSYFVKSRLNANCESAFSLSDIGSRGVLPAKAVESALPLRHGNEDYRLIGNASTLYLRLHADEAIDASTIWGDVRASDAVSTDVAWQASPESDGADGWLVYTPGHDWREGDVVTFTGGALTTSGAPVGPASAQFLVASAEEKSATGVTLLSAMQPTPSEMVGSAYSLGAEVAYLNAQVVSIPLPNTNAHSLDLFYFDGGSQVWRSADEIDGWLASDVETVTRDGVRYAQFSVWHGGIVCFVESEATRLSQASFAKALDEWAPLAITMLLLGCVGRRSRSRAVVR